MCAGLCRALAPVEAGDAPAPGPRGPLAPALVAVLLLAVGLFWRRAGEGLLPEEGAVATVLGVAARLALLPPSALGVARVARRTVGAGPATVAPPAQAG